MKKPHIYMKPNGYYGFKADFSSTRSFNDPVVLANSFVNKLNAKIRKSK